jgi:hypothetical protein
LCPLHFCIRQSYCSTCCTISEALGFCMPLPFKTCCLPPPPKCRQGVVGHVCSS